VQCGDCNDGVFAINPNVSEVCNRIDDNCNRVVDEGLFIDLDLDGFGDAATSDPACAAHYRLTDCDDRTNLTLDNEFVGNLSNPSRTEVPCDGLDNDCNPATPDSTAEVCDGIDTDCNCGLYNNPLTLFVPTCIIDDDDAEVRLDNGLVFDNDGDDVLGFADAIAAQCEAVGYVRDCNDNDGLIPGPEECDGVDNDCDRVVDEDFFVDSDGDLWPDNEVNANDCGGLYNLTADCAPLDRNVNPGVDEEGNDVTFCNNLDDDCNNDTGLGSNGGAGALE
jgi:hypothetical protein